MFYCAGFWRIAKNKLFNKIFESVIIDKSKFVI